VSETTWRWMDIDEFVLLLTVFAIILLVVVLGVVPDDEQRRNREDRGGVKGVLRRAARLMFQPK
jgi:hypothetical protein